jgi:hypothetical protein
MSNSQARLVRALIFACLFPLCFAYLLPISRPAIASTGSPALSVAATAASNPAESITASSDAPAQLASGLGGYGDTITVTAMR